MANIVQAVRDDLDARNVSPSIIEKSASYTRRAVISVFNDGAVPPKRYEVKAEEAKEEKKDGNDNLLYNFIFLPDDFLRLDKFTLYNKDTDDNTHDKVYQKVSTDMLLHKREDTDERKFFSITDYNLDDERSRKILVLDPYPDDDDYIEIRYFKDGTDISLENLHERYWEAVIAKVHEILNLKTREEADSQVARESANWRNQEGKDSYNQTHVTTTVRFPWGKTP